MIIIFIIGIIIINFILLHSFDNLHLGIETKMNEDDDEEKKATVKEVDYHAHSKQTKKRLRHVQRQVRTEKISDNEIEKIIYEYSEKHHSISINIWICICISDLVHSGDSIYSDFD